MRYIDMIESFYRNEQEKPQQKALKNEVILVHLRYYWQFDTLYQLLHYHKK